MNVPGQAFGGSDTVLQLIAVLPSSSGVPVSTFTTKSSCNMSGVEAKRQNFTFDI